MAKNGNEKCSTDDCTRDARMAVASSNPYSGGVMTRLWYDNRDAPKNAERYCREHGVKLIAGLVDLLTDIDEPQKEKV